MGASESNVQGHFRLMHLPPQDVLSVHIDKAKDFPESSILVRARELFGDHCGRGSTVIVKDE